MWNQEKLEIEPRKMELFFLQKTGAEVDKLGLNLLNQEQCRFLPRWDGEGFKPGVAYFRRHLLFHIYLSIHRFLVAWTVPSFLCKKNYIPSFIKTLIDLICLWFKSHIVFSLLKHAKTTLFFFCFFFNGGNSFNATTEACRVRRGFAQQRISFGLRLKGNRRRGGRFVPSPRRDLPSF